MAKYGPANRNHEIAEYWKEGNNLRMFRRSFMPNVYGLTVTVCVCLWYWLKLLLTFQTIQQQGWEKLYELQKVHEDLFLAELQILGLNCDLLLLISVVLINSILRSFTKEDKEVKRWKINIFRRFSLVYFKKFNFLTFLALSNESIISTSAI